MGVMIWMKKIMIGHSYAAHALPFIIGLSRPCGPEKRRSRLRAPGGGRRAGREVFEPSPQTRQAPNRTVLSIRPARKAKGGVGVWGWGWGGVSFYDMQKMFCTNLSDSCATNLLYLPVGPVDGYHPLRGAALAVKAIVRYVYYVLCVLHHWRKFTVKKK